MFFALADNGILLAHSVEPSQNAACTLAASLPRCSLNIGAADSSPMRVSLSRNFRIVTPRESFRPFSRLFRLHQAKQTLQTSWCIKKKIFPSCFPHSHIFYEAFSTLLYSRDSFQTGIEFSLMGIIPWRQISWQGQRRSAASVLHLHSCAVAKQPESGLSNSLRGKALTTPQGSG